jgi:hypothetical protein
MEMGLVQNSKRKIQNWKDKRLPSCGGRSTMEGNGYFVLEFQYVVLDDFNFAFLIFNFKFSVAHVLVAEVFR